MAPFPTPSIAFECEQIDYRMSITKENHRTNESLSPIESEQDDYRMLMTNKTIDLACCFFFTNDCYVSQISTIHVGFPFT